jgi:hypothetical protein
MRRREYLPVSNVIVLFIGRQGFRFRYFPPFVKIKGVFLRGGSLSSLRTGGRHSVFSGVFSKRARARVLQLRSAERQGNKVKKGGGHEKKWRSSVKVLVFRKKLLPSCFGGSFGGISHLAKLLCRKVIVPNINLL